MNSPSDDGQCDPLIVTLRLDEESSRFFDRQRREFFPPERNFLAAHVTLFHKLPREREAEVRQTLSRAAMAQRVFPVQVRDLHPLGRGVAYALVSDELSLLRGGLAAEFADMLTPQDRQPFQPHVTVQNKVTPAAARALLERLLADFRPWTARGLGLDLWEYRGGPWAPLGTFAFGAERESGAAAAEGAGAASSGCGN